MKWAAPLGAAGLVGDVIPRPGGSNPALRPLQISL